MGQKRWSQHFVQHRPHPRAEPCLRIDSESPRSNGTIIGSAHPTAGSPPAPGPSQPPPASAYLELTEGSLSWERPTTTETDKLTVSVVSAFFPWGFLCPLAISRGRCPRRSQGARRSSGLQLHHAIVLALGPARWGLQIRRRIFD
jgi:hypothetical protein